MPGDYNTEALIFKLTTELFVDLFKDENSKMKENTVALNDNHLSVSNVILKQNYSPQAQ